MSLVSDNAADNSTGTGAQQVEIDYLDNNGNPQSEIVTMNGTTNVKTKANNIRFVQFIHVFKAGTNLLSQGNITIFSTSTPTKMYDKIVDQTNMSLKTARMVPANTTLFITGWSASAGLGTGSPTTPGNVNIRLRATMHPSTGQLAPKLFHFLDNFVLFNSEGTRNFTTPIVVPSLAIVKVTAYSVSLGANVDAQASWEGYLMPS